MLCYGIRYLLYKIASYHLLVLIDVRKPWGRNETDSCRQAALTKLVEQLHSAFCSISAFGQIWPLLEFDRKAQRSIGRLFLELIYVVTIFILDMENLQKQPICGITILI